MKANSNSPSFRNTFKRIDLFGRNLSFEENNTQSFQTIAGSFLTLLLLISVVVISFLFGREIYEKKTPYLLTTEEFEDDLAYTDLRDFPIILVFGNAYGVNLDVDLETIFNIYTLYYTVTKDLAVSYQNYYGISKCNAENYPKYKDKVNKIITNFKNFNGWDTYCIYNKEQADFTIKKPYSFPSSSGLKFIIQDCNNELRKKPTIPYSNSEININDFPECLSNKNDYNSYFLMRVDMLNTFLNYKDYRNPNINFEYSIVKNLNKGLTRNLIITLGKEQLSSDDGWLLENLSTENISYIHSIRDEPYIPDYRQEIVNIQIEVNNKIKKTTRVYLKIQELFAKIGGLFNALYLLLNFILYDYVRFKYRSHYSCYTIEDLRNNGERNYKSVLSLCNNNIKDKNMIRLNPLYTKGTKGTEKAVNSKTDKLEKISKNDNSNNNMITKHDNNFNKKITTEVENDLLSKNTNNLKNDKSLNINNSEVFKLRISNAISKPRINNFINKLSPDVIIKNKFTNIIKDNKDKDIKSNSDNSDSPNKYNTTANNLNSMQFVKLSHLNFFEETRTIKYKRSLLNYVFSLNYIKYCYSRLLCCKKCKKHAYYGEKLIDSSLTKEHYSFYQYLEHRLLLSTFVSNITNIQEKIENKAIREKGELEINKKE